ncbi:cytochrome c biogenesis CcdA family protein [Hydrogenophaga sp. NFH-34]|uniref:cytochrome c biogenesis CcdA family protein n=1 Tax=Hydrogenophaga sp. NFH-34 TaxID=2744446 RepID=UPI001F3828B2|nr:cytochrome c biogenesis protein CcdA [Hydrogenophaga sp. NFH-34]
MTGEEGLIAAFVGGLLTSASPCVLAAVPVAVGFVGGQAQSPRRAWSLTLSFVVGMNLTLVLMGLAAARLGLLMGALPGPWLVVVGLMLVGLAAWLWRSSTGVCGLGLPQRWQPALSRSGHPGALLLGGLIGTVMSPCATPALAAALAVAGSGAWLGTSTLWGAALLLAYGIGHSALVLLAGAMPAGASRLIQRATTWQHWLPGRRSFATLLGAAGLYWSAAGLAWV